MFGFNTFIYFTNIQTFIFHTQKKNPRFKIKKYTDKKMIYYYFGFEINKEQCEVILYSLQIKI